MSWRTSTVVGILLLTWGARATTATYEIHVSQGTSKRDIASVPDAPTRSDIKAGGKLPPLRIAKIRLGPAPRDEKTSAVLKFDMSNVSSRTLTDIAFQISVVEESRRGNWDTPGRVIAGPFTIRGKLVLEPGYTAEYEILLRNVSSECRCAANVRVLSVRSLLDSGS
jgi:hypothetical protein